MASLQTAHPAPRQGPPRVADPGRGPGPRRPRPARRLRPEREVLHGLTFSVAPGEIVAVMGRNGMGKTTLMKT